ncbi:MAG: hypothetical protein QW544_04695, partial [Candidatus Caldarchaeum sp.]
MTEEIVVGSGESVELKREEAKLFERHLFAAKAHLSYGTVEEYLKMLEKMRELEKQGEIDVFHVADEFQPVTVRTLSGRQKKIPTVELWQHKSCGQCGHIPGYVTSLYWIMKELD